MTLRADGGDEIQGICCRHVDRRFGKGKDRAPPLADMPTRPAARQTTLFFGTVAVFATLVFILLAWWPLRNLLPVLGVYIDRQFEFHFKRLKSCHKISFSLGFFVALLYAFVLTLAALF